MAPRFTCLIVWAIVTPFSLATEEFDIAYAINQAGVKLFGELTTIQRAGNLVLSPYSIQSALALAYAGAEGTTRAEMSTALFFPRDEAAVQQAFGGLRSAIATCATNAGKLAIERRRNEPTAYAVIGGKRVELQGELPDAIEWHEANRLFAQSGYAFRRSFLTLMREGYAAPFEALDLRHDTVKARDAINRWVAEQTRGRIPDLIPGGGLSADSRLILVNALYLKAAWDKPFEKTFTKPELFHLRDGIDCKVPMMRTGGYLGYAHDDGITVVVLPYIGRELQFLVLLPDADRSVDAAAAKLSPRDFARWAQLGKATKPALVSLHLPKLKVQGATLPLGEALRRLGMKSAFDEPSGSANFDRIAPRRADDYLNISEVFHQTFISLNEEGTEAAAATAVVVMFGAMVDRTVPIEVRVDRPFLFAIQHRASGTCLFLGRVSDPR